MSETDEELKAVRCLALDYVKLLYEGKIYSFSGHHLKGECIISRKMIMKMQF